MFLPDGMPVRARLSCTFIEVVDPTQEAQAANLQTADFSKVHVVVQGETLSAIAAGCYDDPGCWRPIAIANGIADPRAIARRPDAAHPVAAVHRPRRPARWWPEMAALRRPTRRASPSGSTASRCRRAARGDHQPALPGRAGGRRPGRADARQRPACSGSTIRCCRSTRGFELELGYAPDPLETVFVGEITGVEASFPSGGMPTLTVVAHDFLQRLTVGHQGPRVRAEPAVHRQVPAARPGHRRARRRHQPAHPVGRPGRRGAVVPHAADRLRDRPARGQARRSASSRARATSTSCRARQGERLGDVHRPHARTPQGYVLRFQFLIQDYTAVGGARAGASR